MDPFAARDFDAVRYLNKVFSDQASLTTVDEVRGAVNRNIKELVSHLQYDLEDGASRNKQKVTEYPSDIAATIEASKESIRQLGEESVSVHGKVDDVCREIKKWDMAKKALQHSISTQRRVEMLEHGREQLQRAFSEQRYDEVGNLVRATGDLCMHLADMDKVPAIARLIESSRSLLDKIREKTYDLLELSLSEGKHTSPYVLEMLANIVDSYGDEVRADVISRLFNERVEQYRRIFDPRRGGEHAEMVQMDRRYSWISRIGSPIEQMAKESLPQSWHFAESFYHELMKETADHVQYLTRNPESVISHVIPALNLSIEFEDKLIRGFPEYVAASKMGGEKGEDGVDETTAEGIRRKFERFRARGAANRKSLFFGSVTLSFSTIVKDIISKDLQEITLKAASALSKETFECPISSLVAEKTSGKKLEEELKVMLSAESDEYVLESSTEVFLLIKTVFERQATLVARAGVLVALHRGLVQSVVDYCKKAIGVIKEKTVSRQGREWGLQAMMVAACLAVNTVNYCQDTSGAITKECEGILKKNVHLEDQVKDIRKAVAKEDDFWLELTSKALKRVLKAIESICQKSLAEARDVSWSTLDDAGDISNYMRELCSNIRVSGLLAAAVLKQSDFEYCWSATTLQLMAGFRNLILSIDKASDSALQQLLLDSHSLAEACEKGRSDALLLADAGGGGGERRESQRGKLFLRSLQKEVSHTQGVLKAMMAPEASRQATYEALVEEKSEEELKRIMKQTRQ